MNWNKHWTHTASVTHSGDKYTLFFRLSACSVCQRALATERAFLSPHTSPCGLPDYGSEPQGGVYSEEARRMFCRLCDRRRLRDKLKALYGPNAARHVEVQIQSLEAADAT